jgi:hypothetical protein
MDGVENLCSSEQNGVGFPSLVITKRLIPAYLSMLEEQAREIEQESGTPMRRIMSGRGFIDYS